MSTTKADITLFKSLFRGREDVFAIRWEKGSKSGYMPACHYDPYMYRLHKMNGGTFENFESKSYLPYSDEEIEKHLKGIQQIGIYPLLEDNSSWLIVADFDKAKWESESKAFCSICLLYNLPAYLERSRSGKGAHVWVFFQQPYSAFKSRHIFISLLEKSGAISAFAKGSSFDRLFPNQDILSGKGYGNLIALPLFKKTLDQGNSCFVDAETLKPFVDQWAFLQSVNRAEISTLDNLYEKLVASVQLSVTSLKSQIKSDQKLQIRLGKSVILNKTGISLPLSNYLKDELNFLNDAFIIKKKMGKNTWGINRYFNCIEDQENHVIVPRGFTGKLIRFCKENSIVFDFKDERLKHPNIQFYCQVDLRDYQKPVLENVNKKDFGIIVAPPGTGKTVIALKLIAEKQQPTLIVVHRKQLAVQWIERIQTFLGIPLHEIGMIGQGKSKVGKQITIATIQSLTKVLDDDKFGLPESFGTIVVDECHHIPAESFRRAIGKLETFYLYGLTATPFRKYSDGKLIFIHLGEIIAELKPTEVSPYNTAKVIIRNTTLDVPFNSKTDRFETLSNILIHDSLRNQLIAADIITEIKTGKRVVVLTERKEHIESLNQYLKLRFETITLSGDDSATSRSLKWQLLKSGHFQVLITTGQLFGEGADIQNAESLFLVYPFSFQGKLIQYMGRVQRSEVTPTIYDYRDIKIDYLNKLFLKRNRYYRKLEKQATLFDDIDSSDRQEQQAFVFDQLIKLPLKEIEFRHGSFAFNYLIKTITKTIEFEIENDAIRPELEVLKPYFAKTLKMERVDIEIYCEFLGSELVAQTAQSKDLERINREIIEGVKFKFVSSHFFGMKQGLMNRQNLQDLQQLQIDAGAKQLFESEQVFIENLLANNQFKHQRQIRYLAQKHEPDILKIRFVLSPFAFVFLFSGDTQYHLVMETLNTEEATYIWHIHKSLSEIKLQLTEIDQQINTIKLNGRQQFLENAPANFSRLLHDYSDERKGFVVWRDQLEAMMG